MRSYTAGILEVKEAGEKWDKVGDNLAVTLTVKVKVDKEAVTKQLAALRKNAEATQALEEANRTIREYERKIAGLNQELQVVKVSTKAPVEEIQQSKQQIEKVQASRRQALTGIEVETLLAKAQIALIGTDDPNAAYVVGTTSVAASSRTRSILNEAYNLDREHPTVLAALGELDLEEENYQKAASLFREAIRLKPDDARPHSDLGLALAQTGRLMEAVKEFREAIRLKPTYVAAVHASLAVALKGQGDRAGARQEFQEACQLGYTPACAHASPGCATIAIASTGGANQFAAADMDAGFLMLMGSPALLLRRKPRDRKDTPAHSPD